MAFPENEWKNEEKKKRKWKITRTKAQNYILLIVREWRKKKTETVIY